MPYEPSTRVLSVSFVRDPAEQADVTVEAGRRWMTGADTLSTGAGVGIAVGFGAVAGLVMEIHRRFVLPLVLGSSDTVPLGTMAVQLLPLILLLGALFAWLHRRAQRRWRQAMTSRLTPGCIVDVDLYSQGVSMSGGQTIIEIDWEAVRDVIADKNRIEIECEGFVVYVPARAFDGVAAYAQAVKDIRQLWRDALRLERDRKMIEAGLD
jgi:hypothetical protein